MSAEDDFARKLGRSAARKANAQRGGRQQATWGLGMLGSVGWSVAVPTLAGALLGGWIDRRHPGPHSWTLALLILGLTLGCANAWRWVSTRNADARDEEEDAP